jgi:hypothetical protein
MDKYSIDYSDNQTDYGIPLHIPQNEPIVITPDAVFIKPLKLVVLTEDVYNKLKEKDDENN